MIWTEALLRLCIAAGLGAAVGFERQWRNHYAGLRTVTLVTIGSAGMMIYAYMLPGGDIAITGRLAGQIITGVGFLCAGVIMHEGINVKGLNTAATLWCSVGIGIFAGSGMHAVAMMMAAFIILTNLTLRPIVYYINSRTPVSDELEAHYTLSLTCQNADAARLRSVILAHTHTYAAHLKKLESKYVAAATQLNADFVFQTRLDGVMENMVEQIAREPGIATIEWHLN